MYYSSGNFEGYARPLKPEGVEKKTAWIVGSGLAGLSTAAFLVRDAQMPGEKITILEELDIAGGALDGFDQPGKGLVIRGGREMEAHFECLWDLFRSVPSIEVDGASVLDEFYWLNKRDPNFSLQRAIVKQGQDAKTGKKMTLGWKARLELMKLFLASSKSVEGKRINEVLGKEFFESNFWMYWRTMFAFQEWHSALEMKLYLHRFVNHIGAMPDFSSIMFTRYNQYESFVLPLEKWLKDKGVRFVYGTEVRDVDFAFKGGEKMATKIHWVRGGEQGGVDLGPDDLVFMTIGSLTENSGLGDHKTPAKLDEGWAPAWEFWRKVAAKHPDFGHPDVFGTHIPESKWMSATVTMPDGKIPSYLAKICKRDPYSGRVTSGGIVTVQDSAWLMSWTVNRQPHFKKQPKGTVISWVYGLLVDVPGDFVKKPMQECSGEEIVQEWLYHLGVPAAEIPQMARESASCVPVMMPYVTSFFMPRAAGDRPDVVPQGAKNFAFLGQFAETVRDTIFTTEYSVRTGMEAVYRLLGVDRGVPEVFASTYDVRTLLGATFWLRDGEPLGTWIPERARNWLLSWLDGTVVGEMLREYRLV